GLGAEAGGAIEIAAKTKTKIAQGLGFEARLPNAVQGRVAQGVHERRRAAYVHDVAGNKLIVVGEACEDGIPVIQGERQDGGVLAYLAVEVRVQELLIDDVHLVIQSQSVGDVKASHHMFGDVRMGRDRGIGSTVCEAVNVAPQSKAFERLVEDAQNWRDGLGAQRARVINVSVLDGLHVRLEERQARPDKQVARGRELHVEVQLLDA